MAIGSCQWVILRMYLPFNIFVFCVMIIMCLSFYVRLQLGVKWEIVVQIGAQTLMPYGYNFLDNFKVGLY
jgi:hypothetical protein